MSNPISIQNLLIFTDLDATLLDHDTYSFAAALPLLNWLREKDIPVIPTTSKTHAELSQLREGLRNSHPFIVENGSSVFIPVHYFSSQPAGTLISDCGEFFLKNCGDTQGDQHDAHCKKYDREHCRTIAVQACEILGLKPKQDYETFQSLGAEGIADLTGLTLSDAKLANQRLSSEPIYLNPKSTANLDQRKKDLVATIYSLNAAVLEGGRFLHVLAPDSSKGAALLWLKNIYNETPRKRTNPANSDDNKPHHTIALGDSQNDVDMLEAADRAILVRNPHKAFPLVQGVDSIIKSKVPGPLGWQESLCDLLKLSL